MEHKPFVTKRLHLGVVGSVIHQLNRFSPDDPYERCALILDDWHGGLSLYEVDNVHDEPEHRVRVMTSEAARVRNLDPSRLHLGWFHTHNGRTTDNRHPSNEDRMWAAANLHLDFAVFHPFTRLWTWYSGGTIRSFTVRHDLRQLRRR